MDENKLKRIIEQVRKKRKNCSINGEYTEIKPTSFTYFKNLDILKGFKPNKRSRNENLQNEGKKKKKCIKITIQSIKKNDKKRKENLNLVRNMYKLANKRRKNWELGQFRNEINKMKLKSEIENKNEFMNINKNEFISKCLMIDRLVKSIKVNEKSKHHIIDLKRQKEVNVNQQMDEEKKNDDDERRNGYRSYAVKRKNSVPSTLPSLLINHVKNEKKQMKRKVKSSWVKSTDSELFVFRKKNRMLSGRNKATGCKSTYRTLEFKLPHPGKLDNFRRKSTSVLSYVPYRRTTTHKKQRSKRTNLYQSKSGYIRRKKYQKRNPKKEGIGNNKIYLNKEYNNNIPSYLGTIKLKTENRKRKSLFEIVPLHKKKILSYENIRKGLKRRNREIGQLVVQKLKLRVCYDKK